MPKTKKAEKSPLAAAEAAPEHISPAMTGGEAANGIAVQERRPAAEKAAADQPAYAADPHEKLSVSLSDVNGGPEMHLLRSHKFKQMQIRFDREQPDEKHRKMLKDAGWTDRTEREGVYTKQIDPNARWQSVQKMEEEFKAVANSIRKDKGLGPVLKELAG
jgi:hypothetical protein